MTEGFNARRVAIVVTTKCTLNCKLCSNHMPRFKETENVSAEDTCSDIDRLFDFFDHIDWLQFVGGEIFLNKQMADIYRHALKYADRMDKLVLMTNATLLPTAKELSALSAFGKKMLVQISNYGALSYKLNECKKLYMQYGIPFEIKIYHGDTQHYGGWVDNTDISRIVETSAELIERTSCCPQVKMQNMHYLHGRLHRCSNGVFLSTLGVAQPNEHDYVDLRDTSTSIENKRLTVADFYNHPTAVCCVCRNAQTGKNVAKRYQAAEQLCR